MIRGWPPLETYSFSTPFGFFVSQSSQKFSKGLRVRTKCLPDISSCPAIKNCLTAVFYFARPTGIFPSKSSVSPHRKFLGTELATHRTRRVNRKSVQVLKNALHFSPVTQNPPKGGLFCATDRTWTGNLPRALIQYFHNGVDYIFTLSFSRI